MTRNLGLSHFSIERFFIILKMIIFVIVVFHYVFSSKFHLRFYYNIILLVDSIWLIVILVFSNQHEIVKELMWRSVRRRFFS